MYIKFTHTFDEEKGINIEYVTLHVGLGTFRPVNVEDVTKHKMHSEFWAQYGKNYNISLKMFTLMICQNDDILDVLGWIKYNPIKL